MQRASGIILDDDTKQPLDSVALGKFPKEDISNSYSRRTYSNQGGKFEFSSIGGGFFSCDFELYFSKAGYETNKVKFEQLSKDDTIYLKRLNN